MHFNQEIVAIREGVSGPWTDITDSASRSVPASSTSHTTSESEETAPIYPLYVRTSSGAILGCDFVVSATGVLPCVEFLGREFARSTIAPDDSSLPSHTLSMSPSSPTAASSSAESAATMTFSDTVASHVELVAPPTGNQLSFSLLHPPFAFSGSRYCCD